MVWIRFIGTHAEYDKKLTRQKYKSNGNTTNKKPKKKGLSISPLARLELIFDAKKNSKERRKELEILSIFIEKV